jgi:hypothetical protein
VSGKNHPKPLEKALEKNFQPRKKERGTFLLKTCLSGKTG